MGDENRGEDNMIRKIFQEISVKLHDMNKTLAPSTNRCNATSRK